LFCLANLFVAKVETPWKRNSSVDVKSIINTPHNFYYLLRLKCLDASMRVFTLISNLKHVNIIINPREVIQRSGFC